MTKLANVASDMELPQYPLSQRENPVIYPPETSEPQRIWLRKFSFQNSPIDPIWGCIKTNLAIFGGMNIHLPVIWGSLGYQGFDSYPY